jgi:hypothetical protein
MIVGGGSLLDAAESSIRVVPSAVQKLSQPSVNVWLHFGQRFIFGKTSFVSGQWSVAISIVAMLPLTTDD